MAITFRSSVEDEVCLLETVDGHARSVTAKLDPTFHTNGTLGGERWLLELEHRNGWTRTDSVVGTREDAIIASAEMLRETRTQFRTEARNGHRQPLQLDPMHTTAATPIGPVISMPSHATRYRK